MPAGTRGLPPRPLDSPWTPPVSWSGISPSAEHPSGLESSPLWARSQGISAPAHLPPPVSDADMHRAMQQALQQGEVTFRSEAQREALETIVQKDDYTPLVVVLPTGGGKSRLFTAPACLEIPGVTVVVVPYRALLNRLLQTAQAAEIDCIEWKRGKVNLAALVFVSADVVVPFLSYARVLVGKGLLRRVFVDESHLTFTASNWRAKLTTVRQVRSLCAALILLTATLPPALEFELEDSMASQLARYIRTETTRVRTRYTVDVSLRGQGGERVLTICGSQKGSSTAAAGTHACRSRRSAGVHTIMPDRSTMRSSCSAGSRTAA